jgi:RimJ/RimL family protein N-acetyltransferase
MQNEMKIITLSPERWAESKALRIEALTDSPIAFGMSLEEEIVRDDASWKNRLEEAEQAEYRWLVYLESEGKLVGVAGAYREKVLKIKHTAYIVGVYITPAFRGQGWARKMMETLFEKVCKNSEVNRLELQVTSTQASAVKLYESLGFAQVGVLHKEMLVDGVYYDQIIMEKFLHE